MGALLLYFLIINAAGFCLMCADKLRAQKNQWRVRESTLLTVAALGGSPGCLAAMYLMRHKTRHPKFALGIPVMLALQVITGYLISLHYSQ